MFQHIDIIQEAYKGFSGFAWFSYDEAFRHTLSVYPGLQWGSKDVGLWLNLFLPQKPSVPRLISGNVNPVPTVAYKKGLCFSFNDSQCRWPITCRYKHECGGSHPVSKCFRKMSAANQQQPQRDFFLKGSHSSDSGKNASMVASVSKRFS